MKIRISYRTKSPAAVLVSCEEVELDDKDSDGRPYSETLVSMSLLSHSANAADRLLTASFEEISEFSEVENAEKDKLSLYHGSYYWASKMMPDGTYLSGWFGPDHKYLHEFAHVAWKMVQEN
jgi:hypothetical protein